MRVFESTLLIDDPTVVGMFGAIEWQYLHGPVFADYPYLVDGRVIAIGESPKTEWIWLECLMKDAHHGRSVARMLMLSRLLKDSSQHWRR